MWLRMFVQRVRTRVVDEAHPPPHQITSTSQPKILLTSPPTPPQPPPHLLYPVCLKNQRHRNRPAVYPRPPPPSQVSALYFPVYTYHL